MSSSRVVCTASRPVTSVRAMMEWMRAAIPGSGQGRGKAGVPSQVQGREFAIANHVG